MIVVATALTYVVEPDPTRRTTGVHRRHWEFEYSLDGGTLQLIWRKIESADGIPDPNTDAGVRYVSRGHRIPR